jgi:isoaspartyl peptidase/L-asparaginase-like protein (Ntn-hydrolase superfamily)
MRFGMSLEEALEQAMNDLAHLDDPYKSEMNIVALDKDGNPGAASTTVGKTYVVMREDMDEPDERHRMHAPVPGT